MRKSDIIKTVLWLFVLWCTGIYFMGSLGVLLTPGQGSAFTIFFIPVLLAAIFGVMHILLRRSPDGLRFESQPEMPYRVSKALLFSMIPMHLFVVLNYEQAAGISAWPFVLFTISLFLLGFGKIFRVIEPNWVCGMRMPTTVHSVEEWKKVHRRASYLMLSSGTATLIFTVWYIA